ncbi:MAG: acyl-CoA dehydratase activase [Desulfosudaceae bacterium]
MGASTVSLVQMEREPAGPSGQSQKPRLRDWSVTPHEGNPRAVLLDALAATDLESIDAVAATGRKFRNFLNLSTIPEPEAVELAYQQVKPPEVDCPAVVAAGGETFMVYVLDACGRIANVVTGNKCASGTGEFFLQQLRRMDVSLEEAAQWAAVEKPYQVSGRCSVFCKSDCTHATNKGVPRSRVTAGLCRMMAFKILELLKNIERRDIMLTGGTAQNQIMVEYLRSEIPGLIIPEEAPCFEAMGAALWAFDHETVPCGDLASLLKDSATNFESLPPLEEFFDQVHFKQMTRGEIQPGDDCLLGLDVGSTTTKAVLMRQSDQALLASIYLRTGGDPVQASRRCYQDLLDQVSRRINPGTITISGLGVCGSGRQIAGLHALTDGVINEIIAHATAAVYFDPEVDTLFEIGGQDAKYTLITNGVPSDYAMNEACSAGTGSFLEESALETLGLEMTEIAEVALTGRKPPNFNDQCAAFIASDIKNAVHEGISHPDIVAGLVYSICMNYANRVKGSRPVGEKIFMQGGVCYNRAVPLAMASLVGKPIIVPPEPGLMGAFGVALAVQKNIEAGLMTPARFDLATLARRQVIYKKTFICGGGKEKCDRRCEISRIEVEGKTYPFGGACNRYYNLRRQINYDIDQLDLVRLRQHLIFDKYAPRPFHETGRTPKGRIGINRSFLVNSYFPLYAHFFTALGFEVVLPDKPDAAGIDRRNAAFCYPAELAHGFFYTLLNTVEDLDYIFLPHFKAVPGHDEAREEPGGCQSQVCPLVQGEPFYLRTTFRRDLACYRHQGVTCLTPRLDLTAGLEAAETPLIETALRLGCSRELAEKAFAGALAQQEDCQAEMVEIGKKVLTDLASDPERFAVVLLARPYNGLVDEAHMGIPHKFASRGLTVIPVDFLDLGGLPSKRHMYWGMGKLILKAARLIKTNPQLFGTYITNFSCGPDSFLVGYFSNIMGRKPSLTLELDSHTADAGLETRIEAFIDIVQAYRKLRAERRIESGNDSYQPAALIRDNGNLAVTASSGKTLPLTDPRVTMLLPAMGELSSQAFAAVLRGLGFKAISHEPADEAVLKLGRANTSCKECLPLSLTTGALLNYIHHRQSPEEVLVYFIATGDGPCRFGQYYIFMEDLIKRLRIPNVALMTISSENAYGGMGADFEKRAWWAVVVSDVMEDIRSMLLTSAADTDAALTVFREEWADMLPALASGSFRQLKGRLRQTAARLGEIPLERDPLTVPVISLTGEIFVRRDGLSRQYLTEHLAEKGFATICSPIAEWVQYCNYLVSRGITSDDPGLLEKLRQYLRSRFQDYYQDRIRTILARSGLVHSEAPDVNAYIEKAAPYMSPALQGEAILTIGGAMTEVVRHTCGVIAIGPFGCMPNRLAESILTETMTRRDKLSVENGSPGLEAVLDGLDSLPFLSIESDGSPFPQLIHAKLETFCLRAERLHRRMQTTQRPTT